MPTQAKKDGNARHIAKLDVIKVQPYKEEGAAIRAAAAAAGQSVQAYILQAVRAQMERERAGGGVTGTGAVSIFPDGEDTSSAVVDVSPTQDKESSPAEHHEGEDLPS